MERPILFSGPMVRAILDGRKTQTRRVVRAPTEDLNHPAVHHWQMDQEHRAVAVAHSEKVADQYIMTFPHYRIRCPYGVPGDRLWVRETWAEQHPLAIQDGRYSQPGRAGIPGPPGVNYRVIYRADGEPLQVWRRPDNAHPYFTTSGPADEHAARFPTVCSNYTRNGKAIYWTPAIHMPRWASRITLELTDVRVERLQDISGEDAEAEGITLDLNSVAPLSLAKHHFRILWDGINAKRAPWASNPWVWVVEFAPRKGEG
jgi:hypothetical protein